MKQQVTVTSAAGRGGFRHSHHSHVRMSDNFLDPPLAAGVINMFLCGTGDCAVDGDVEAGGVLLVLGILHVCGHMQL